MFVIQALRFRPQAACQGCSICALVLEALRAPCLVLCEEPHWKRSHRESKGTTHRLYAMLPNKYLAIYYTILYYMECMMHLNVTTEHLSQVGTQICSGPFMACLQSLTSYNLSTNLARSDMPGLLHYLCLSQAQSSSCNLQQACVIAEPSCTAQGTSYGRTGSGS